MKLSYGLHARIHGEDQSVYIETVFGIDVTTTLVAPGAIFIGSMAMMMVAIQMMDIMEKDITKSLISLVGGNENFVLIKTKIMLILLLLKIVKNLKFVDKEEKR